MNIYLAIAVGGAVGAVLRHALVVASGATVGQGFHSGHFLVNVSGSFLIGVLAVVLTSRGVGPEWRAFAVTGVLGAFTTYSAFSFDALMLVENGDWAGAAWYVSATLLCCLLGCWLGFAVARAFA